MRRLPITARCLILLVCALATSSCSTGDRLPGVQSIGSSPVAGVVDPTATQGNGWRMIDGAMELRELEIPRPNYTARLTAVRFDPAAYRVSVKYDIANAGTIREWFDALDPLVVVNGGYFDANYKPTALVIFDGIRRGESYDGFGGMVVINEGDQFELRSLRQQPYNPDEPLRQAMQSAPMLIQPGGQLSDLEADQDRSRRTVIARDSQGRILLIVSNEPAFTLTELAETLHQSDLQLDAALNLDGGRSTGLYVQTERERVTIDSFEKLPLVLVVERRS
jgi:uncharacterized protein YigE (DUF2233 family)